MHKIGLILLLAGALTSSCKKQAEVQPPPTRTELLVGKKWQVKASTIEAVGSQTVDTYALSQLCSRDDYEQYNAPNTYVYDEGPTKCFPADPQTQLGVWSLINNDSGLVTTLNGISSTYTIEELTATSLKLSMVVRQSNGVDATIRITYASI